MPYIRNHSLSTSSVIEEMRRDGVGERNDVTSSLAVFARGAATGPLGRTETGAGLHALGRTAGAETGVTRTALPVCGMLNGSW